MCVEVKPIFIDIEIFITIKRKIFGAATQKTYT